MTSRRGFLSLLSTVAAAAVLDPERALWVPGKKLISIPTPAPMGAPETYVSFDQGMHWFLYPAIRACHEAIERDLIANYPYTRSPAALAEPDRIRPIQPMLALYVIPKRV